MPAGKGSGTFFGINGNLQVPKKVPDPLPPAGPRLEQLLLPRIRGHLELLQQAVYVEIFG
jgi:hypothetical protein